jgi:alpha-mannosidase
MIVELRRGEPFVRLEVSFDNRARDHRVRLHVPCSRPTNASDALGQFAVTRRGRHPEAGPVGEYPLATYPANSFVDAGGTAILVEGTTEYELLADPHELAITLLRGAAFLSRDRNAFRDEPAGPNLPTPLGQSPGPRMVRLAVLPHAGDWEEAGLVDAAEDFVLGAVTRSGVGPAGGALPAPTSGFQLTGDGVVLSSLVRSSDASDTFDVRLVALTTVPTTARLRWPHRTVGDVRRIGLLGDELTRGDSASDGQPGDADPAIGQDGSVSLAMRPFELATVRLHAPGSERRQPRSP